MRTEKEIRDRILEVEEQKKDNEENKEIDFLIANAHRLEALQWVLHDD